RPRSLSNPCPCLCLCLCLSSLIHLRRQGQSQRQRHGIVTLNTRKSVCQLWLFAGNLDCMNTNTPLYRAAAAVAFLALVAIGCDSTAPADDRGGDKPSSKPVDTHKVEIGKNVTLEVQGDKRRVLINSTVCLQRGALELLMCRKQTKEHESILTSDSDARDIHKALVISKAEPGKPARYLEKGIQPPTGTKIKISG